MDSLALTKLAQNRFFNPPSRSNHFSSPTNAAGFLSGATNADNAIKLHFSPSYSLVTTPPKPIVKINYDNAVFRETNEAGLGVIVRDNEGHVLASLAKKIPLPQSVADVEAAVAQRALILAKELQFNSIVLEGDSAIITRLFKLRNCL